MKNDDDPDKRLPKGIRFPDHETSLLREFSRTSLSRSVSVTLSDWLLIFGCLIAGSYVLSNFDHVVASLVSLLVLFPLSARAQRGFENLTHEASHFNLTRKNKRLNDLIADWFCSAWVLIGVRSYRRTHIEHHSLFGTTADPDRKRFARLGLDGMPRKQASKLILFAAAVMPRYVWDYWRQFRSQKLTFTKSLFLHATFMIGVSVTAFPAFWKLWLIFWWIPFLFYLPVLRFFAEAEEHRYANAPSEYAATYSNLGTFQKWYLHPHGDAFHLLHHLWPAIPHWRLSTTHQALSAMDREVRNGMARHTIFDNPQQPGENRAAA